jgi:hypothetical protein
MITHTQYHVKILPQLGCMPLWLLLLSELQPDLTVQKFGEF